MADKNFDYLGNSFQLQLLNQIVVDKDFAHSIVEVLESNYFENKYYKLIVQMVKEYYAKFEHSPSFETLQQKAKSEISQELLLKITLDTISDVKNVEEEGVQFVQEKALKFCKQQELQKVMDKAKKIIDNGEFESYDTLEEMVREALQVGNVDRGTGDVFENLDEVLADDYRHPIPMGIPGIDNLLKGGLAKGEIGPRALGNRSILMRADIKNGKDILNNQVKHRESYRPFGCSVLLEDANTYMDCDFESPYMLYGVNVKDDSLKSITHIDGTTRPQTVKDGIFAELLYEVKKLTGSSIILNTSLNVNGYPIANPEMALKIKDKLDGLFVGDDIHV